MVLQLVRREKNYPIKTYDFSSEKTMLAGGTDKKMPQASAAKANYSD